MPFDPTTKKKVFDPKSAQPLQTQPQQVTPSFWDGVQKYAQERGGAALNALSQPGGTMNKAIDQFGEGNILAGGANTLNAFAQIPGAAMNAMTQLYPSQVQRDAGNFINQNVLGAPAQVAGYGVNQLDALMGKVIPFKGNLGLSDQQAQDTRGAIKELATNVAIAPVTKGAGMMAKAGAPLAVVAESKLSGISEKRNLKLADKEFMRSAPPIKNEINFKEQLGRASKLIGEEARKTPIDKNLEDSPHAQTMGLIQRAQDNLWNKKITPLIKQNKDVVIPGNAVRTKINSVVDEYLSTHEPAKAKSINDYADTWTGDISLESAQNQLRSLNASLKQFYKKSSAEQTALENQGAPIAAKEAAASALRDEIVQKLPVMESLRKDYGALAQMHEAVRRNKVKAENQVNKPSLLGHAWRSTPFWVGVMGEMTGQHFGVPGAGLPMWLYANRMANRSMMGPTLERAVGRYAKATPGHP
jgi:hypothetical protein